MTSIRTIDHPIENAPALRRLARWYDALREREAYRKWVMVSFEALRGRLSY